MRSSMYLTGRPQVLANAAARVITLWVKSLLPKLPPAIVGTKFSLWAGTPSDSATGQPRYLYIELLIWIVNLPDAPSYSATAPTVSNGWLPDRGQRRRR